jgi:hypothetical protein
MQDMNERAFGVHQTIFSELAVDSSGCYRGTRKKNIYTK